MAKQTAKGTFQTFSTMKKLPSLALRLLAAALFLPMLMAAKHIVGGDFSYTYVGPGTAANSSRWHFTMNVYRDDNSGSSSAPLDQEAVITIYDEVAPDQYVLVTTLLVPLQKLGNIPVTLASPCLTVPPDIATEHGRYEFDQDLPIVGHSYHIIYQRCCRNVTISNIATPGDVGATFMVELTSAAQQLNNSGPVFKNFPPVALCANVPLVFDHSAVDTIDGDVLKYSLCAPLKGGGNDTSPGGAPTCTGSTPNPACPPPFGTVSFITPFTAAQPMGGNPAVVINPTTGVISGKPTTVGQFVVGVCVEEYRNGVLISVLRRDFQFNVVDCQPTVLADIKEDSLSGSNTYKVISCGSQTLKILNESFYKNNIDNWYWLFDLKGVKDSLPGTSADFTKNWDALVTFPDTGNYKGILVLNPGTVCGDTAEVVIKIRPDIKADFEWHQDSCVRGLTQFIDKSKSGGGPIRYWEWSLPDTTITGLPDFSYIYETENDHNVRLFVVDTSGCQDSLTLPIPYLHLKQLAEFDWSPKTLNSYQKTVTFTDLSLNPVKWQWLFDKFGASSSQNPVFEFPDTGQVTVRLYITDDRGCRDSVSHRLDIVPFISWFMPNAFTPDDDGINDTFLGKGVLDGASGFNFSIWSRWGEEIFSTKDPETGWNGRKHNTGKIVPAGVYVYLVTFTGPRGDKFEYKGFATVVR